MEYDQSCIRLDMITELTSGPVFALSLVIFCKASNTSPQDFVRASWSKSLAISCFKAPYFSGRTETALTRFAINDYDLLLSCFCSTLLWMVWEWNDSLSNGFPSQLIIESAHRHLSHFSICKHSFFPCSKTFQACFGPYETRRCIVSSWQLLTRSHSCDSHELILHDPRNVHLHPGFTPKRSIHTAV